MNSAPREIVKKLREEYPEGTRVVLDKMDDPYTKIPVGTQGTVTHVDDMGSIHVRWDNGSGLAVVYGDDKCHKI